MSDVETIERELYDTVKISRNASGGWSIEVKCQDKDIDIAKKRCEKIVDDLNRKYQATLK